MDFNLPVKKPHNSCFYRYSHTDDHLTMSLNCIRAALLLPHLDHNGFKNIPKPHAE